MNDILLPNGVMSFTYLKDTPEANIYMNTAANADKFSLIGDIKRAGFQIDDLKEIKRFYGQQGRVLPVFIATVRKKPTAFE